MKVLDKDRYCCFFADDCDTESIKVNWNEWSINKRDCYHDWNKNREEFCTYDNDGEIARLGKTRQEAFRFLYLNKLQLLVYVVVISAVSVQ